MNASFFAKSCSARAWAPLLAALGSLLLATTASAQWSTTTYALKGGWNAIYLNGDATQDPLDNLFPTSVLEVWRWNANPEQVQFTESPLVPSAGTAEWSVWRRGLPAQSTLSELSGQTAYLVKCSGTASTLYSVALKQSPRLPAQSWVRNGANLLGFPSSKVSGSYPTLANYFATFPAAVAANTRIYKYVGGDLGAGNPLQIFSPASERLDATQAYWFSAEVTGDFYAPIEISPSTSGGLHFGRDGSSIVLRIRNRTAAAVTLTFSPVASEAAPNGQTAIAGSVPLTRRIYSSSLVWTETPIAAAYNEAIGPQTTLELTFGINRGHAALLAATSDARFASLLRVTDSGNLIDVAIPATAQKSSLAGLWMGDIALNSVVNKVSNGAHATATNVDGSITALTLQGSGGFGYTTPPAVTIAAPHPNGNLAATAAASVNATGAVTALTPLAAGNNYLTAPDVTLAAPPASVSAAASAAVSSGAITSLTRILAGTNYTAVPALTIAGPPASVTATAAAALTAGAVSLIDVTSGGSYYTAPPTVTVAPPTVAYATATATLAALAGSTGAEILHTGTLVEANHFGATGAASLTLANGLTFGVNASSFNSGLGGFNSSNTGLISTITNVPYSTLLNNRIWIAYGSSISYLAIPNLTIGKTYRIQLISVAPQAARVAVEGNAAVTWGTSRTTPTTADFSVLTATWTAQDTTANVTLTRNGNEIFFNGYALHDITALKTATANATLTQGAVTGFTVTAPGSGYTTIPDVTVAAPLAPIQATATCALNGSSGVASGIGPTFSITNVGRGYPTAPTISFTAPPTAVTAEATATLTNGTVTGYTLTEYGSGYPSAPVVTVANPPSNSQATATATIANGSVTGFTITDGGSGYEKTPAVTLSLPPSQIGNSTAAPFRLRTLLHVSDGGTATLLSRVFLGQLAAAPYPIGLCTRQNLLKQDALATAQRFTSAHLPLDQIITSGSGSAATGSTLTRTVTIPFNDPTNPFVHAYHPDHDNKNARGEPLDANGESLRITRNCSFTFTASPPAGSSVTSGWGSSVIGGTYEETLTGLHKDTLTIGGTFELRRASEVGTLSQ